MSPFPSRISLQHIVDEAITLIEAEGTEKLSVNTLAQRLGVKTPSLYRYVSSKADLLRAVNQATSRDLIAALHAPLAAPADPETQIMQVCHAYRAFAHRRPITYGLLFTNTIPELRPDPDEQESGALPLQALVAEITGQPHSLPALRGLWALLHGFIVLELAGQFQRGGDLDAAFIASVRAYLRGWRT
jgi:AcrR family transcriptional regulator